MRSPASGEDQRDSSFRNDLQGLRGWAVLAVVIFHFFPQVFPNGFLGVDVFFVLSGFLVARMLEGFPTISFSSCKQFYFRRVRRIFPLLLLTVFVVLAYSAIQYSDTRLFYQTRSALFALSFASNFKQYDQEEEYFMQLDRADDNFTHTWSLAVEMQFYAIAPLIYVIGKKLCCCGGLFTIYLSLLGFTSLVFQSHSSANVAFSNVFARLWQFMLGAVVYNLELMENEHQSEDSSKLFLDGADNAERRTYSSSSCHTIFYTLIIWTAVGVPATLIFINVNPIILRPFVSAAAATAIFMNASSPLLTHHSIVFLGDCSYSLYLLHWPAVCVLKQYDINSTIGKLLTIFVCICLSHLCYIFYEKWYTQRNGAETLFTILLLYFANGVILVQFDTPVYRFIHENILDEEAKEINFRFNKYWVENLRFVKCKLVKVLSGRNPWGIYEAPKGAGNLSFMSIGNSYNANHARLIMKHFRAHYSSLFFHSIPTCLAISDGTDFPTLMHTTCDDSVNPIHEVAKREPDVLFVIQRFFTTDLPLVVDIDQDRQFNILVNSTMELAKHTRKLLFIMNALPQPNSQLQELVHSGKNKEAKRIADELKFSAEPLRHRLKEVVKRCSKCILFDLFDAHLSEDGTYMNVDLITQVNLFEKASHHTPYALKLMEPIFTALASNFSVFRL